MARQQFQATEGLLEDVMRKQAGSVEKAVLEAVMNSVDAGADNIIITIDDEGMIIQDDGEGMSEDDINNYFRQFGLKDSDIEDKEFGKFRMGRGQIFNFGLNIWSTGSNILVVNLNEDETDVWVEGTERQLDTEGLSYHVLESEDVVEGCKIDVRFYEYLEDVNDTVREIKNLIEYIPWLHDVDVTINGEEVYNEIDPDKETGSAYYSFNPGEFTNRVSIYNKGAFVKEERIARCSGVIITKNDLDVNFSRNDILDNDPYWRDIEEEFRSHAVDFMLEDRGELNQRQKRWLIERAKEDDVAFAKVRDEPIIDDVSGSSWSLEELSGEDITFTNSRNKQAAEVMERSGTVVLDEYFEEEITSGDTSPNTINYKELVEDEMQFEFTSYDDDELSKRRLQRLNDLRNILRSVGFDGDVSGGYSRQQSIWKNDEGNIFIDKEYLNETKDTFLTDVLFEVVEVAAHNGSTIEGLDTDHRFYREYHKMMKRIPEEMKNLI